MTILGIDPGTARLGFGIVKKYKKQIKCLQYGIIETKPDSCAGKRLKKIQTSLFKLIKEYKPDVVVVEKLYFFKNLKTAMPVSEAKGVVLLTAARKNIPVIQLTPLEVKMNISGYGRASKEQIQEVIKKILKLKEIPKPDDAADALALSICGLKIIESKK